MLSTSKNLDGKQISKIKQKIAICGSLVGVILMMKKIFMNMVFEGLEQTFHLPQTRALQDY